MRHLILLGTGGTIATRSASDGRRVAARSADLLDAAEAVWGPCDAEVEPRDLTGIPSFAAGTDDVLALARAVRDAARDADGVVVTHGTDTMEEAAFLLAMAHTGPEPVVVTGAQRPFDDPAPDGGRNLAAALRWAADPRSAGSGVTIAFADAILPAIGARKVHTLALGAFAAPGRGPVARVDETGVRRHSQTPLPPALLDPDLPDLPRVDVVSQYLGVDATAVEQAVLAGARGVVVAGFGAGNATPAVTSACLRLLEEDTAVMVASRTGAGPVAGLYAGGGADLLAAGAILAGDLSPWQARLLLAAAVAEVPEGRDRQAVARRCVEWMRAAGVAAA